MKVWSVLWWEDYEQAEVVGVFDNQAAADRCADELGDAQVYEHQLVSAAPPGTFRYEIEVSYFWDKARRGAHASAIRREFIPAKLSPAEPKVEWHEQWAVTISGPDEAWVAAQVEPAKKTLTDTWSDREKPFRSFDTSAGYVVTSD